MTVWCFRDGVLATDSMCLADRTRQGSIKKCTKSKDGWLAGGAGNATDMVQFLRWVDEGRTEGEALGLENLEGILVSPKGIVSIVEGDLHPFEVTSEFHAGGIGAAVALGAMEMGATAIQAVEAAIKHNSGCGGEIQIVKLGK